MPGLMEALKEPSGSILKVFWVISRTLFDQIPAIRGSKEPPPSFGLGHPVKNTGQTKARTAPAQVHNLMLLIQISLLW
jgi:hypothetical protein